MRNTLHNKLGFKEVETHQRYLGLSTFSGRSKRAVFQDLCDRIWKKLKGWKEKGRKGGASRSDCSSHSHICNAMFWVPKSSMWRLRRFVHKNLVVPEYRQERFSMNGLRALMQTKKRGWNGFPKVPFFQPDTLTKTVAVAYNVRFNVRDKPLFLLSCNANFPTLFHFSSSFYWEVWLFLLPCTHNLPVLD